MEFDATLLRKVKVDPQARWIVAHGCLKTMRKCFESLGDASDQTLRLLAEGAATEAVQNNHVFENPKRATQMVAYAPIEHRSCWLVISKARDKKKGDFVIVTMKLHKDKDFSEELKALEEE